MLALPAQRPLPALSSQLEEHMHNCTAACFSGAGSSSLQCLACLCVGLLAVLAAWVPDTEIPQKSAKATTLKLRTEMDSSGNSLTDAFVLWQSTASSPRPNTMQKTNILADFLNQPRLYSACLLSPFRYLVHASCCCYTLKHEAIS